MPATSRQPRPYRRCQACSLRVAQGERRCAGCGSDAIAWAYRMDINAPGEARKAIHRSGLTRDQAIAEIRAHLDRIEGGRPEPSKITVGQWLAEWLPSVRDRVRGSAWASYEAIVRMHLAPALGVIPLRHLRPAQVESVYAALGRSLSAKSVHNAHLVLRSALEAAVRNDLLERNPAARGHRLPTTRPVMRTWDADQLRTFLQTVAADDLYAMWRVLALTGARRGEVLGLRWSDVDLAGAFISIQQQLSRQGRVG